MRISIHVRAQVLGIGAVITILGFAGLAASQSPVTLPAHTTWTLTAAGLLSQSIPDSTPDAARLRRGQYLVAAGDCMSCHLRDGGEPLAGGLGLKTPVGLIYSANITSARET